MRPRRAYSPIKLKTEVLLDIARPDAWIRAQSLVRPRLTQCGPSKKA